MYEFVIKYMTKHAHVMAFRVFALNVNDAIEQARNMPDFEAILDWKRLETNIF